MQHNLNTKFQISKAWLFFIDRKQIPKASVINISIDYSRNICDIPDQLDYVTQNSIVEIIVDNGVYIAVDDLKSPNTSWNAKTPTGYQ